RAVAGLEERAPPEAGPSESGGQDDGRRRPEAWEFHKRSARDIAGALVRLAFAAGASDLLLDEQEEWMDVAIKLGGRKEILPPVEKASSAALLKAFKEIAGLSTNKVAGWQSGSASIPVDGGRQADL